MATLNYIILIVKVLGQAMTMIDKAWEQFKIYEANKTYTDAGLAMDAAISNYHAAVYKKDNIAAAQALHDLATGATPGTSKPPVKPPTAPKGSN